MSEQVNSFPWFAVHIRMHNQESVEASLDHKGYEVFAPSYVAKRVVAGRERPIRAPLFPGYLFCALDPQYRLPVLVIPGVIGILGTGNILTPIPTLEIETIRRMVASGLPLEPFRLLQPGEPVEICQGPLAGIKGVVVHHKGRNRLVISVSALNDRAVSVEVDEAFVARLAPPALKPAIYVRPAPVQYYKQIAS